MPFSHERLREERERSGLTLKDLARRVRITRATLNTYELGITQPQVEKLERLARFFDKPIDYFFVDNFHSPDQQKPNSSAT